MHLMVLFKLTCKRVFFSLFWLHIWNLICLNKPNVILKTVLQALRTRLHNASTCTHEFLKIIVKISKRSVYSDNKPHALYIAIFIVYYPYGLQNGPNDNFILQYLHKYYMYQWVFQGCTLPLPTLASLGHISWDSCVKLTPVFTVRM